MTASASSPPIRDAFGQLLGRLDRWLSPLETVFNFIAAISILLLMFLGVAQIVGRTVFNAPVWGYIDIVELSMSIFAFMGIAYCQRLGGHVRMELGLLALGPRSRQLAEALAIAVGLFVIAVMIYYGYEHTMRAYTSGDSTIDAEILVWPSKALVPIAFSLLWLRLLIHFFGHLRLMVMPDAAPVGVYVPETIEEQARKEALDSQTNPMAGGLSE
ncbi:MAG: TRAP transporter small permease [Burkholderiaceae bacterium]